MPPHKRGNKAVLLTRLKHDEERSIEQPSIVNGFRKAQVRSFTRREISDKFLRLLSCEIKIKFQILQKLLI